MMSLPALVFCTQIESTRMLEVRWKDHGLIPRLTRQLYAEVPRIECHEGEFEILRKKVLLSEILKTVDRVVE